jgi:anti-sigma B factor antagonist
MHSNTGGTERAARSSTGAGHARVAGTAAVIATDGELDMATAPALKRRLLEFLRGTDDGVGVDLTKVTFIDSTAVGVLVGTQRALPRGRRLALVCANPDVLRIFEITGLDGAFAIYSTVEEALEWVEGSPSG